MRRIARDRRLILTALLLAAAALLVLAPVFALAMAPALAAFALVTQRVMPGEDRLVALLAARRPRRRPATAIPPSGHRTVVVHRAGRRLASALAMRPPPASALAIRV